MLEEITMEKKLNRTIQSPKTNAEAKKSQDAAVGKLFPKTSRKREKPGQKVEQLSKKQPTTCQKSKRHARKTFTRTTYHEGGGKNTELTELEDVLDLRGCKKKNLTHLLNFQCKPREGAVNTFRGSTPRGFVHGTIRDLMSTQKHKYNKEQFLQANCQFVVRDNADYSVYLADPDILVDWKLVEQILVSSSEPVTCPICLEYPTAGKITRCGHIYCWPCILHYLALTDKSWHKCPICFEAVHKADLKSVKLLNQKFYNIGDEITFQLMKREQGSTVTIPVLEAVSRVPHVLLPVSGNGYTTVYSKLLQVDYENIIEIIAAEETDLERELRENEGCPEMCFVEQAIELLNDRRQKLFEEHNSKLQKGSTEPYSFPEDTEPGPSRAFDSNSTVLKDHLSLKSTPVVSADQFVESVAKGTVGNKVSTGNIENSVSRIRCESDCSNEDLYPPIMAEDLEVNVNPPTSPVKEFFFYQVVDGQQIFLHSINARMLERQFGSLEHSPSIIKGTIVEIESGSMAEELRKRLRYLQHLPITCQFQVVEINFIQPIISQEIFSFFKDQLEKRTRLRAKRAKEEKNLEKKAQELARKQYGRHSPPRRLRLDSLHHFPECGSDTPPNTSPRNRSLVSSRASSPLSSISRRSTSPVTKAMNSLSLENNTFAQKLKESNKHEKWTKRDPVNACEATASSSPHSVNLSMKDALEAVLARKEKESDAQNIGRNKKKKKSKPVPLCSVGMVYTNR